MRLPVSLYAVNKVRPSKTHHNGVNACPGFGISRPWRTELIKMLVELLVFELFHPTPFFCCSGKSRSNVRSDCMNKLQSKKEAEGSDLIKKNVSSNNFHNAKLVEIFLLNRPTRFTSDILFSVSFFSFIVKWLFLSQDFLVYDNFAPRIYHHLATLHTFFPFFFS